MEDVLTELYEVVTQRHENPQEGSYTCYLFEKGLDKILKKCGEECSEVIIAAKNGKQEDTVGELADLLYHLTVLMVNEDWTPRASATLRCRARRRSPSGRSWSGGSTGER